MEKIKFTLPLPPSSNTKLKYGKGRVYLSEETRNYYEFVKLFIISKKINKEFIESKKIIIWCDWYVGRTNCDVHNFHKVLADAIEKGIEVNDSYYLMRDFDKTVDTKNSRVEIEMFYM